MTENKKKKLNSGTQVNFFLFGCVAVLALLSAYSIGENNILQNKIDTIEKNATLGLNYLFLQSNLTLKTEYNGTKEVYPNGSYTKGVGMVLVDLPSEKQMCLNFFHELGHKEAIRDFNDYSEAPAIQNSLDEAYRCEGLN